MPKADAMDLRERVADEHDTGMGTKAIAETNSISPAWGRRLIRQRRERGDLKPRTGGHDPRKFSRERFVEPADEQPDATLAERCEPLGVNSSAWATPPASS